MSKEDDEVVMKMNLKQAHAVSKALDLYARVCMGQLDEIPYLVAIGELSPGSNGHFPTEKKIASVEQCRMMNELASSMKGVMGFTSGSSHGIGSDAVSETAHRTWEVKKVLDQTLAYHHNPTPECKGVHYDGLILRYTKDKAPVCYIEQK